MFWLYLDRLTSLTFLMLATILVSHLVINNVDIESDKNIFNEIQVIKAEIQKALNSNTVYTENRINTLAQRQDEYQVSTSARLNILETRVGLMEKENKQLKMQSKIVNNNQSTATIYTK